MKQLIAFIIFGLFLFGCATNAQIDAQWEAYIHQHCEYDRVTFEKIEKGSPGYKLCRELVKSGFDDIDLELYGEDSFSQFIR